MNSICLWSKHIEFIKKWIFQKREEQNVPILIISANQYLIP